MSSFKYLKRIICFILLYTIFTSNSSIFYILANNLDSQNTTQIEETDNIEIEPELDNEIIEQQINVNDPLNLTAESAVLIDAETGIVIYDKNMNQKSFPASTTKILTALLALENSSLSEIVTHSHNAIYNIGEGSSHIGIRENEQLTMEQALYGVLLASANEVCMAIAEHISGTVDEFINLMNKRALEIGALNTHFTNPHGFHDENHYTTSYDMALLMKEAIKNDEFLKFISTKSYTIPTTNIVNEERILNNSNKMIFDTNPNYYQYAVGGKTGFTDEAGNTLVSYAKKGDIGLIAVVMQDKGTSTYDDTKILFEYGFDSYSPVEVFNKSSFSSVVPVVQEFKDNQYEVGEVEISTKDSLYFNLPKTVDISKLKQTINLETPLIAPIRKSDVVGTIDISYENNIIATADIVADANVDTIPESKLQTKENIKNIINITIKVLKYGVIAIVAIIILFIALAFINRVILKRRRKRNIYLNKSRKKLKPIKRKRR